MNSFCNIISVSIDGQTIKSNEYASNNGGLLKTIFADGTVLETNTDIYGKTTEEKVNGEVITSYVYDNKGQVYKKLDNKANKTSVYHYNDADKIIRTEEYIGDSTSLKDLESSMQYTYNKTGKLSSISYKLKDEDTKVYNFTYDKDDLPLNDSYPNNSSLTRTYDSLRRLTTKVFTPVSNAKDNAKLYTTYTYVSKDDTINDKKVKLGSLLVDTYTNKFGNKGKAVSLYKYTYDNWGNISSITDNNNNIEEYTYDNDNQLVKATYKNNNEIISTYDYSYDNGGNILSKTINGKTINYEYSNSFKDELTSYDGKPITYNKSGYPVSYMGDEMSFDYAGHLTSIKSSGNSTLILNNNDEVSFTYSDTGNRLSKTYNDEIVKYIYNNDLLLKEIHNNYELSFIYDYSYNITSLIYKDLNTNIETSYFFTFNNQGDIKAIYRSSDSKLIGTYDYDPYGNIISINDELIDDNDILNKNPIRYRGYYLDTETGLYYVHARYYDSIVGRWISIDDINCLGNEGEILSYNLYAYCLNNPVNRVDVNGNSSLPNAVKIGIGLAAIIVGAVLVAGTGGAGALILAGVKAAAVSGIISAGTSTALSVGSSLIRNESISTDKLAKSAVDGFCSGFMVGGITTGVSYSLAKGMEIAVNDKILPKDGIHLTKNIKVLSPNHDFKGGTLLKVGKEFRVDVYAKSKYPLSYLHTHIPLSSGKILDHVPIGTYVSGIYSGIKNYFGG